MARVLGVSTSGYHAWLKRERSAREKSDSALAERVRPIYERSRGTYGAPRLQAELADEGFPVSRKRAARLMRESGLADCWHRSESEPPNVWKVSHLGRVRVYASLRSQGLLESVAAAAAVAVGNRSAGFPRRCGKRSAVFRGAGSFRSRPRLRSGQRRCRGRRVARRAIGIHEVLLRSRVR